MNVVSVCPLRVAALEWTTNRGVAVLTVIAKATYDLSPATCPLAEEQEDPSEYESHWNDDPERSLHLPSDLFPYKPRPEVTLVGQAFAPRGEPVARLVARLIVGSVDKSITVHAERTFSQDGTLRHGARFKRMPVRYERAAGGPDTSNPVGVTRKPDALGVVTLPNLEPPGLNVARADDFIEPVGFGPIAAAWPQRQSRLGRHAGSWSVSALRTAPLPEGIDALYFLSAPSDQHLDELWSNERIVLENLHPDHPRLVTSLPGYEPRAFVEGPHGAVTELAMVCDTLWIDTDRSMCTLTWRGQLDLDRAGMEGRVVIAMQMIGRPLAWSDVAELAAPPGGPPLSMDDTHPRPPSGTRANTATHEMGSVRPSWPSWLASTEGEAANAAHGAGQEAPKPSKLSIAGDVRLAAGGTGTMEVAVPQRVIEAAMARAEAARARPSGAPTPASKTAPGGAPSPSTEAPSWLRSPQSSQPSQPSQSSPPSPPSTAWSAPVTPSPIPPSTAWSASATPSPSPPSTAWSAPVTPSQSTPPAPAWAAAAPATPAPAPAPSPSIQWAPAPAATAAPVAPAPVVPSSRASYADLSTYPELAKGPRAADPPAPARVPQAADLRQATERGAAAASNAAAAGARETAPSADRDRAQPAAPREPAREHVDLLWFDPAALPRVLADKVLGEGRAERPSPRWIKEPEGAREPQEVKNRREILAVVTRGRPIEDAAGIAHVTGAAYGDDGTFTAPLILVAGELAFDFDEVETLRATLSVTAPFLGTDKKLREVAAGATEALKAEGRLPGDIAAGLTRRVEEAFAQGQRSVAPRYLETSVERMLLEDRRYPKKTLFGEPRLRGVLTFAGGAAPIPTYLPDALATRLPLFRRFRIKAVVEVRPQEDQYETHADALLVLALGRVLRRATG